MTLRILGGDCIRHESIGEPQEISVALVQKQFGFVVEKSLVVTKAIVGP